MLKHHVSHMLLVRIGEALLVRGVELEDYIIVDELFGVSGGGDVDAVGEEGFEDCL